MNLLNRLQSDSGLGRQIASQSEYGLHAVDRLDKQTSGVILMACRPEIFRGFAGPFETRRVNKHYRAVTTQPPGDTQPRTFLSNLPSRIRLLPDNDLEMATDGKQTHL